MALVAGLWGLGVVKPPPRGAWAQPAPGGRGKPATTAQRIGLDLALARLGPQAMPTGEGVVMGHVEGTPERYLPRWRSGRFRGVEFHQRSGSAQVLDHADATARVLYGRQGLAPGVSQVHCFAVAHWLGNAFLRVGLMAPPLRDKPRVYNHSWISDDRHIAVDALRRVDEVIDRDGLIMCVGVNNGRVSHVPALLGSAYNVIAVGSASGASSGGYTRIEGEGRCKPDLVAPGGKTSFTTPVVAACAARLLEMADGMSPLAQRPEVIKAVLMAGAVKPWNWRPKEGKPLDEHLGAGVVNLDHSLRLLEAGPAQPGRVSTPVGWDAQQAAPEQTLLYEWDVAFPPSELAVALTWHRRIEALEGHNVVADQPQRLMIDHLADFDLRLIYIDPTGQEGVIAQSTSRIDNVEHIYLTDAPPGHYRLEVIRRDDGESQAWLYGLAWRIESPDS